MRPLRLQDTTALPIATNLINYMFRTLVLHLFGATPALQVGADLIKYILVSFIKHLVGATLNKNFRAKPRAVDSNLQNGTPPEKGPEAKTKVFSQEA